jgi:hypothetical protein
MNGNFDPTQGLKNGDQTVDARGWLTWDPTDQSAEITISVTQNGYTCPAPPITCTRDDTQWRVDVTRPAPPWQRGTASGGATGTVTRKDGTTYPVPEWTAPSITLG